MTPYRPLLIRLTLALLIIGYIVFFTAQLLARYNSLGSRALDLGNMDQAIWNTAQGRFFYQTNQPGITNRLSLHVEPILLPIALLYHVYSGPPLLFVLQTIIVALGAIPVFALARYKLNNHGLALIFAAAYLLYPPLQAANMIDFHPVTLAPAFLLAAFYYLETKRYPYFALFAVLAVSCKEEIALQVMLLGFYALLFKKQYRQGAVIIALTLIWTYLAVFVIPPTFAATQNVHWGRYDHLGHSPADIVLNFLVQPGRALNHLQNESHALTYLRLLLTPTAFIALFNPVTLVFAWPTLGINLLSNYSPMHQVNTLMYAAPLIPAIFISSIYGAANITAYGLRLMPRIARAMFYILLGALVLAASLLYQAQYGYLPGSGQFRGWPTITDHHRGIVRLLAEIPPDAALSAQDRLNPHLSQRQTLHIFDGSAEGIDTIALDITQDSWPLHPVQLRDRVNDLRRSGFKVVDAFDGYLLLSTRPDMPTLSQVEGLELPNAFFDFARVPNPRNFSPQYPITVIFDNKIKLLGYDLNYDPHQPDLPVLTFYWQALEPLNQDYLLWPFTLNREGQIIEDPSERPLVTTLWYPTSRWQPGEIILTRTLPRDLGNEFVIGIGISTRKNSNPNESLAITQADPALYTFENNTWARLGKFGRVGRANYQPLNPSAASQPQQPLQAQFWNRINLQGIDLPAFAQAGQALPFTLYWQPAASIPVNLTSFAHLLDSQGNVAAQLDWTPQDAGGYLPTTAWQSNRPVIDQQTLILPQTLPPGPYRLMVGWYYPATGQRLPLTFGGSGDSTIAGLVTIY